MLNQICFSFFATIDSTTFRVYCRWDQSPALGCSHILIASCFFRERQKLVECTNGLYRSLDETVLPSERLRIRGKNLPILQVPDPDDVRWLNFDALGVITNDDQKFYLRLLKALASSSQSKNTNQMCRRSTGSFPHAQLQSPRYLPSGKCNLCNKPCVWAHSELGGWIDEFSRHSLVFLAHLQRWVPLQQCLGHSLVLAKPGKTRQSVPRL